MSIRTSCLRFFSIPLLVAFSLSAQAQIPVTDVGAIFQLVTEVQTLAQQLQTAEQDLAHPGGGAAANVVRAIRSAWTRR